MLIDSRLKMANAAALGATGTRKLGKAIALDVASSDQGEGYPLYLYAVVDTLATSGGAATFALQLVTASDAALTADVEVLLTTPTFALADLTAGKQLISVAIPKAEYGAYIGVREVVGGANFTGGAVDAFILQDPPNWRPYAEGMN